MRGQSRSSRNGLSDRRQRTTRKDTRIGVPRDRVDLADMSSEPANDVSRRDIPQKDGAVSAAGGDPSVVVRAATNKVTSQSGRLRMKTGMNRSHMLPG